MDPVKISSPLEQKVGRSLWIPFDCYAIQPDGSCQRKLAEDMPIFATKDEVLTFIANNYTLAGRPLNWIEFKNKEIMKIPQLHEFVKKAYVRERSPLQ